MSFTSTLLMPHAAELPVEYLLSRSRIQFSPRYCRRHLPSHDGPLQVGIRVVL
jgi:hypothetical protein